MVSALLLLTGCGTTDAQLEQAGYNASYIQGFHDGRHSGMEEAGNDYETYIRDGQRYANDEQYRNGWIAGEAEGRKLQNQASMAGNVAAGVYQANEIGKAVDKNNRKTEGAAKEALKGVDTSGLKVLEEKD